MLALREVSRPNFAGYLRLCGMVRYDSHQVAREPSRRWWICHGSDGWVRAVEADRFGNSAPEWIRHKLARAGISVTSCYILRFKRLPNHQEVRGVRP